MERPVQEMSVNQFVINPGARADVSLSLFKTEEYDSVNNFFCSRPNLQLTPLWYLPGLASEMKIRNILLKDESRRFGLNSFKILGVSYAVGCLLSEGRIANGSVLVCATEGNHGRAVARAARDNGLNAKIYMSADAATARIEAITEEGAEVVLVDGNYDDAVHLSASDARIKGWIMISDTSWPGYEEIPRRIMAGYTRLLDEAESEWSPEPPPDIVVVQAGVGGLACAVASWLCQRYGAQRPFTIVCEPVTAACLLESARAGKPVSLRGPFETIMGGLRCGNVSSLGWPTIAGAVDAFVSIDDEQCTEAMRILAHPLNGDPLVIGGASGACGFAALHAILQEESLRAVREASGVSVRSRILVINTEGATDPELYVRVTARPGRDGASDSGSTEDSRRMVDGKQINARARHKKA
jgi:diaminopropionate ammonia-lyase